MLKVPARLSDSEGKRATTKLPISVGSLFMYPHSLDIRGARPDRLTTAGAKGVLGLYDGRVIYLHPRGRRIFYQCDGWLRAGYRAWGLEALARTSVNQLTTRSCSPSNVVKSARIDIHCLRRFGDQLHCP